MEINTTHSRDDWNDYVLCTTKDQNQHPQVINSGPNKSSFQYYEPVSLITWYFSQTGP